MLKMAVATCNKTMKVAVLVVVRWVVTVDVHEMVVSGTANPKKVERSYKSLFHYKGLGIDFCCIIKAVRR